MSIGGFESDISGFFFYEQEHTGIRQASTKIACLDVCRSNIIGDVEVA